MAGARPRTPATVVLVVASVLAVASAACSGGDGAERPAESPASTATTASGQDATAPDTTTAAPTATPDSGAGSPTNDDRPDPGAGETPAGSDAGFACRPLEETSPGRVEDPALVEASGIVASRRHQDVLWAHNDSGLAGGVHGLNLAGERLGFWALGTADDTVAAIDIEDIALFEDRIHLADIGDNTRSRSSVAIHVFDEPTPGGDGNITEVTTIEARYPDGPTDAEALLVDPLTGELLIMSKDLDDRRALTRLYAIPPRSPAADATGEPVTMEPVGSLDVAALSSRSSAFSIGGMLYPGSVTGADISADGSVIAVRTYGSVWLFARQPDQTMAEALASDPCEGGAAAETQGESVGLLTDRGDGAAGEPRLVRYVTVSEGTNPPVNLVTVEVGAVSN